jgi:hypothetical protein
MRAEIIVSKGQALYRIERGRAAAEVAITARPRLKIYFNGGALNVSLTTQEAYRLGAALIISAEHEEVMKRPRVSKRIT